MLTDLATNLVVWLCAATLLLSGLFMLRRLYKLLHEITQSVEAADDNQIMLNGEQLNVRLQITKGLTQIRAILRSFRSTSILLSIPITILVLILVFVTNIAWGPQFPKSSPFDAFLFSLAFFLGMLIAVAVNFVLVRLSSVAGALGAIGASDRMREVDTAAAYSSVVRRVSYLGLSSGVLSISLMMVGGAIVIHIAIGRYEVTYQNIANMGYLLAAFSLGHCTVYASQSIQGALVSKATNMVFERFEVDMYNFSPSPLQLLNSTMGDGLSLPLNLFQTVSDVVVCWVLTVGMTNKAELVGKVTQPSDWLVSHIQTVMFLPFILLGLSALSFCIIWVVSLRVPIISGQALIRRTRFLLIFTAVLNLCFYGLFLYLSLPPADDPAFSGPEERVYWYHAWGVTMVGGIGIILLVEVAEFATSPQFAVLRSIAKNVDVGSSSAYLASQASSQVVLLVATVLTLAALYGAYAVARFQGFAFIALGSLAPLCCAVTISTFALLAANCKHMASMANLSREVIDILEQLAYKCDVIHCMAYTYSSLAGVVISITLCVSLTVSATGDATVSLFSAKGLLFVLLGVVAVKLISSLMLFAVTKCVRDNHKLIKRAVESASAQSATAVFNVSGELEPTDQLNDLVSDMLGSTRKLVVLLFLFCLLTLPTVGFGFGMDAILSFVVGMVFSAWESSFTSGILAATTESIKSYVVQGGLIGDSQFGFHHIESLVASSIGAPQRLSHGTSLLLLVRMMLLMTVIGTTAFSQSGNNDPVFSSSY